MKDKFKTISFNNAFTALSKSGARMMIMHTAGGDEWFVVPGGRVTLEDAQKIMKRANVVPFDDGLFPGHTQSWKIAGT